MQPQTKGNAEVTLGTTSETVQPQAAQIERAVEATSVNVQTQASQTEQATEKAQSTATTEDGVDQHVSAFDELMRRAAEKDKADNERWERIQRESEEIWDRLCKSSSEEESERNTNSIVRRIKRKRAFAEQTPSSPKKAKPETPPAPEPTTVVQHLLDRYRIKPQAGHEASVRQAGTVISPLDNTSSATGEKSGLGIELRTNVGRPNNGVTSTTQLASTMVRYPVVRLERIDIPVVRGVPIERGRTSQAEIERLRQIRDLFESSSEEEE